MGTIRRGHSGVAATPVARGQLHLHVPGTRGSRRPSFVPGGTLDSWGNPQGLGPVQTATEHWFPAKDSCAIKNRPLL